MKATVVIVVAIVSAALAVPIDEYRYRQNIFRMKKSPGHGTPYLGSIPMSALYMDPQGAYSDIEPMKEANMERAERSYYGAEGIGAVGAAAAAGAHGLGLGGVYSQFPGASAGGYGIPLLMSCSPHIVPGHLVRGGSSGYSAYKNTDDDNRVEAKENMVDKSFPSIM